jgi:hypothetical protein
VQSWCTGNLRELPVDAVVEQMADGGVGVSEVTILAWAVLIPFGGLYGKHIRHIMTTAHSFC